jgi:hypothetical protein
MEMASISSFVPSEEIRKLTFGSYEHLKAQVEEAIGAARERLFESTAPVQILATFAGHALVLSEDAKVFRVKFEQTERGGVEPIAAEALSIPAYNASTLDRFTLREAQAYVDAFFNGAKTDAASHLQTLLPLVKGKAPAPPPTKITEAFQNLVKGERGWKKVYTERLAQIRAAVQESLPKLDEGRLTEKFRRLYDGRTTSAELSNYKGLVTSDLKYLGERIESLLATAEKDVAAYKGLVPALKVEERDATVKMFESFSEDFVADLRGVQKALTEANNSLNAVDDFGKIYDVLASELHRYEVAGCFVGQMSRGLAKSEPTEEG